MNLIFYGLAAIASSHTLGPAQNRDLESKLDQYQAATGIDDDKRNEIWTRTMDNCKYCIFLWIFSSVETLIRLQSMIRNFSLLVHVLVLVYSGIDMGRRLFVNYNFLPRKYQEKLQSGGYDNNFIIEKIWFTNPLK